MSNIRPQIRSEGLGAPVVLLHSSASSGRQWQTLAATLGDRYRTHAVDLYGHGGTPAWPPPRPMRLDDEIALVEPRLHVPGGVHLVGHSYGAALALKIAARHPGLVKSVAVWEPVLFRLLFDYRPRDRAASEVLIVAASMRHWLALGHPDRAAQRFIDFWSGAGSWEALSASQQQLIAKRMPTVATHFHALFNDSLDRVALSRLPMPVLCLTGAKTRAATRRIGELLRHAMPFAVHGTLAGMGHMGPVTHSAAVAMRIAAFLDGLPRYSLLPVPLRQAA